MIHFEKLLWLLSHSFAFFFNLFGINSKITIGFIQTHIDSLFPGIGVPAVAGSGIIAANSISFDSLQPQLKMLEEFRQRKDKIIQQ